MIPGLAIASVGLALAAWSMLTMRVVTPFPEPRTGATLVTRGPYRLARHPMYGGFVLFFVGLSLIGSIASSVAAVALALLWWRKSIAEERRLAARFPEYAEYHARTPRRFFPYVA